MSIDTKNLDSSDLNRTLWRYMTFPKYISLITYGALWFSKLNILVDAYEGAMPTRADADLMVEYQSSKRYIEPSLHGQIDSVNKRNVEDGRELILANCWFLGEAESERMWEEYAAGSEAIAIKSTVAALAQCVFCDERHSRIGKVKYIDFATYEMTRYEASQAIERAFLKSLSFSHEQEIRIVTLSFKGGNCVNIDGTPMMPSDYAGAKMNNFDQPGLHIQVDLRNLIKATVLAPNAPKWFEQLVKRIVSVSGVGAPVQRSRFDRTLP